MSDMQKNLPTKKVMDHKVIVDNRKKATITAVSKAVSANNELVVLLVNGAKLNVIGKGLHIGKLDVNEGIAEVDGQINSIKYLGADTGENKNLFKRLFK